MLLPDLLMEESSWRLTFSSGKETLESGQPSNSC